MHQIDQKLFTAKLAIIERFTNAMFGPVFGDESCYNKEVYQNSEKRNIKSGKFFLSSRLEWNEMESSFLGQRVKK